MRSLAYTRFELVRTFRNVRLLVFSFGFPLVLYFLIAAPNRHQHNFNGSGIPIPLYYMVGLVAFGAMTALVSSGCANRGRADRRLDAAAEDHTARDERVLRRQGHHRLHAGRPDDRVVVRIGGLAWRQPLGRTLAWR